MKAITIMLLLSLSLCRCARDVAAAFDCFDDSECKICQNCVNGTCIADAACTPEADDAGTKHDAATTSDASIASLFTGVVHNAASCAIDIVRQSYLQADEGDRVVLPECDVEWDETLEIVRSIEIIGAGSEGTATTKISYGGLGSGRGLIEFTPLQDKAFRVSGVVFDLKSHDSVNAALKIQGSDGGHYALSHVRFDHNKVLLGERSLIIRGHVEGVVDNNRFDNCNICINYNGDDRAWDRPIAAGTADSLFIEDNSFVLDENADSDPRHLIYLEQGARVVIRHNDFDGRSAVGKNSKFIYSLPANPGNFRGQPIVEVYENSLRGSETYSLTRFGSGVVLFWNNTMQLLSGGIGSALLLGSVGSSWPAEDQINNSFFWGNCFLLDQEDEACDQDLGAEDISIEDPALIQLKRDFWMSEPCPGPDNCGRFDYSATAGGDGEFVSGASLHHPYEPYPYPHPFAD